MQRYVVLMQIKVIYGGAIALSVGSSRWPSVGLLRFSRYRDRVRARAKEERERRREERRGRLDRIDGGGGDGAGGEEKEKITTAISSSRRALDLRGLSDPACRNRTDARPIRALRNRRPALNPPVEPAERPRGYTVEIISGVA